MNQYIKTAGAIIGFAFLIGISIIAYNKLSKEYGTNRLQEKSPVENEKETTVENTEEETESETSKKEDDKAPDFTVVNANDEEIMLSELVGKPIILNFWASWCSPCKSEMPTFQKIYEEYGDEVEFVIVNMTDGVRETKENAMKFIAENKYTFPVYYDVNQSAAYTYSVSSIPTTYFIDSEGNVTAYSQGAMDEETLLKGITMITEETK